MSVNVVPRLVPVKVTRVPPCTGPLLGWTEVMFGGGHWSEDVKNMLLMLHSSMTVHSLEHQPHWNPGVLRLRHEEQPVASSSLQLYRIPTAENVRYVNQSLSQNYRGPSLKEILYSVGYGTHSIMLTNT